MDDPLKTTSPVHLGDPSPTPTPIPLSDTPLCTPPLVPLPTYPLLSRAFWRYIWGATVSRPSLGKNSVKKIPFRRKCLSKKNSEKNFRPKKIGPYPF